ncbi:MAG: hypothetical protein GOMPHAMPRED_008314 [Gomphillus americanus]|uniref:Anaphase-promoting complex subunit 2 n=1 Tax=Gomphillus americanus TaxID=1940652 RepID=A0A8H3F0N8_9LECA|nr:MAG: hypothetical protein GOMPHAMPRED_008314 [Gomphillus americanus]
MTARRRIFESVFPSPGTKSLPTPQATPLIGAGSFAASSGGSSQEDDQQSVQEERTWHHATEYLSVPNKAIAIGQTLDHLGVLPAKWTKEPPQIAVRAIQRICDPTLVTNVSGKKLYSWYLQEISRHYLQHEMPLILAYLKGTGPITFVLQLLRNVKDFYLTPWSSIAALLGTTGDSSLDVRHLQRFLLSLFSTSLVESSFDHKLEADIFDLVSAFFDLSQASSNDRAEDDMQIDGSTYHHQKLMELLREVDDAGLGGFGTQKILAEVMDEILGLFVEKNYESAWGSPSSIPAELSEWIESSFVPLVVEALACLRSIGSSTRASTHVSEQDITDWKERAVYELGSLRLKQLFELIVSWDDSRGAIEDLKHYLTHNNARAHVITQFSEELSRRLLQPGASTSQILDLYIRLIQAFTILDPRGVLLDRIARPVRRYLREREDTIKLIVSGLLSDPSDESTNDPLAILAVKLQEAAQISNDEDDVDIDWDDPNWVPNPIDAEPEYKVLKLSDVIGHLISLFETRDVFVKEFQNILGERLLQFKDDYEAEIRLLELLKIRFGDTPLQACEVMLKDISDSARIDAWVRREQNGEQTSRISTKVLSRLFWPALHTEAFKLPPEITELQKAYSAGFEKYKTSRKLTWLDVLGDVTVELELEDRTIEEVVKTPQAAVIYAFTHESNTPISKTAAQLVEELEMDEDIVENCLLFWVGKLVLIKSNSSYSVLERLPSAALQDTSIGEASKSSTIAAAAAVASATAAAAPVSALRSEEDIAEEKMQVYWQFIVGMLTNQGAMPLPRIVMMLKLAMAGGFPYSNEELRVFLDKRVDTGKLELAGGNYKLVKGAV